MQLTDSSVLGTPSRSDDTLTREVRAAAEATFATHDAIQLATLGGPYTPWILGAYFTHRASERGIDLFLMVEKHGKTMVNLVADPRVAFAVNQGDAARDFLQGNGQAEILPEAEGERVVAALVQKMPWFKLYTPCAPVRITLGELFVTSFARGWMPAKRLDFRGDLR
jgi:hypothetical protein